jgi:hypothetical protein
MPRPIGLYRLKSTNAPQTPGDAAVLWFMKARELEGQPYVSQDEMTEFSKLSRRTIVTSVKRLVKSGNISKHE